MKNFSNKSFFVLVLGVFFLSLKSFAQLGNGPGAYCLPLVSNVPCTNPNPSNTPGNTINDFIDNFSTSGGNVNIVNNGSGCNSQIFPGNGQANYINLGCGGPYLSANPGQVISFTLQTGIIFNQGFAIFIDWNQDNIFQTPGEIVAWNTSLSIQAPSPPLPASSYTSSFTIPPLQANGTYRMRVRCSYIIPVGNTISPCALQNYGEAEDYAICIGTTPTGTISGTASSNSPVCEGGIVNLNIVSTSTAATSYSWTGPSGYSNSSVQNPTLTNVLPNMGGVYSVTVANGQCPITRTTNVIVVPTPVYNVTPLSTAVCQNGSFLASISTANPSLYTFQWSGNGVSFVSQNAPTTLVNTAPIVPVTATVVYSVVVTPTVLNCPLTTTMSVVINNPPTPTLTMPPAMCNISGITSAIGMPPGGTWYGNPNISPGGIINPAPTTVFGSFPASYSVTVGSCTASSSGNISISRYNTAALIGTIPDQCVIDRPTNLLSLVLNNQGVWSGVGVSANTFSPTGLPTNSYILSYYNPSTPFANVCPASNTLLVNVYNPQTPFIDPILPKCTNAGNVVLLASPPGGVWSGNSGITPQGVYTPGFSNNLAGINTVSYTAGQGTCVATSSATFHVSRFNSAALTTSALDLCVTTNSFELMNLVTSTVNGVWSVLTPTQTPNGFSFVNGIYSFNPAGLVSGNYPLTYSTTSAPDATLCPDFSTLYISLLNPIQPTIGLAGPFCSAGTPFQLSANPATGSFVPSAFVNAAGLFKPNLASIGNNPVQYIIGTSTCNISQIQQISVEAFVSPTIAGIVPELCVTSLPVNLLPLTTTTLGTWSGPGVTGLLFNPSLSGAGTHTLYYSTASSPSGLCPASSTIAAIVYSLAPPVIAPEGPFCNSSPPVKIKANPVGGYFGTGPWVDALGVFNPAFAAIGNNIVTYSVAAGPCISYASRNIKVEKYVSADLNAFRKEFCKFENGLDLSSVVQNPGGTWSGPGLAGSYFTPKNANIGNNNILLYVTQSETFDLCPDTSYVRIRVDDVPDVNITRNPPENGCAPFVVTFNNPSANSGSGEWILGDGSVPQQGLSVSHTYTAPGTYSVVFIYQNNIGCKNQGSLNNPIKVFETPKAGFSYNPYQEVTISDPQVQFINQTIDLGKTTYLWKIDNLYTLPDVNPLVIFPSKGEYKITLTATTLDGCTNEVSDIIVVKPEFSVFVPSSFSPNFDGLNDVFLPVFSQYGLDSKMFDMEIFDRWGRSLYKTKDINTGWDGSLQNKGEPLKEDVYVYKIKYKDTEGKIYNKIGYLSLMK